MPQAGQSKLLLRPYQYRLPLVGADRSLISIVGTVDIAGIDEKGILSGVKGLLDLKEDARASFEEKILG